MGNKLKRKKIAAQKTKKRCYLPDCQLLVKAFEQYVGYQILRHNIPNIWLETEGEGITIAVLDTGCQTDHSDLTNSVIAGWNYHDNTAAVQDRQGHGTHVTGTIVANNNNIGVVGVAPKARVLIIKVLGDEGWGYTDSVSQGVLFAIEQNVDIISMSLGGTASDDGLHEALKKAYNKHIPCICAAGNSGDVGQLDFPGRHAETISIGALNDANLRAEFSQTGQRLDFMAPGVDIYSTYMGNQYAGMSGTSMATPWAAGVVALMMAKHRKIGGKTPLHTVEDVREHLKKTALDLDIAGKDNKTGFGLIDVSKALGQIEPPEPEPQPEPIGEPPMSMEALTTKITEFTAVYDAKLTEQQGVDQQIAALQAQKDALAIELIAMQEKSTQIQTILSA